MSVKPLSPCSVRSCPNPAIRGASRCESHERQRRATIDANRGTASQRGYGAEHRRNRAAFLAANPYCVTCLLEGNHVPSTDAHHIIPLVQGGPPDLFENGLALCHRHHSARTMKESVRE